MGSEPLPTAAVRVLIVDDQRPFRRAAVAVAAGVPGFQVVGEAESGEAAVALAVELAADLVLMDVRLPGIDGVEATRRLRAARPQTRVILISTYRAADLSPELDSCGALGFLAKEDVGPDVLAELWRSAAG